MSSSTLATYTQISPNRTSPRNHAIDTITIHCMAGNLSVERCGSLFAQPSRQASSNYGIGTDGRIALYVEEGDRSWCSSNPANDHRAVTIEVANNGGASDGWPVSDKAYAALIDLVTDICRHNGIKRLLWKGDKSLIGQVGQQNMTVHRWFAAKACPGDYLYNRHGEIAAQVNKQLAGGEEDMDAERFRELWLEMRQGLQDNDSQSYSEEARTWAIGSGLIAGGGAGADGQPNYMWEDVLTREQFVTVLYRFAQLMGKA